MSFPDLPLGWFHATSTHALRRGPVEVTIGRRRYVAFLDEQRRPVVLDGHCPHMGARLVNGCVADGKLQCPLHGWQFDQAGACVQGPPGEPLPVFAKLISYPAVERLGHVFFANHPDAAGEMPWFPSASSNELTAASPFHADLEMPWYCVTANGFDVQHFRMAHDRTLLADPVLTTPCPHTRRIALKLGVTGTSWRDALTRRFTGRELTMTLTIHRGTLAFVEATFARTTTFGLVSVRPTGPKTTRATVIISVKRGIGARIDARVRRSFVRAFLAPDVKVGAGIDCHPATFTAADKQLAEYFVWLIGTHAQEESS